jgi:hypothetical protein
MLTWNRIRIKSLTSFLQLVSLRAATSLLRTLLNLCIEGRGT